MRFCLTTIHSMGGYQDLIAYANSDNLETCRSELKEVLEECILFRISCHLPLPIADGIELRVKEQTDEKTSL